MPARALPLLDQLDFTDGMCSAFAVAVQHLWPHLLLQVLACDDPRYLKKQDWPEGETLVSHAFVRWSESLVLDAEGLRPVQDMLRDFGVLRGYRHEIRTVNREALDAKLPLDEASVNDALVSLCQHGWGPDAPWANNTLGQAFKATRRAQTHRGSRPWPPEDAVDAAWAHVERQTEARELLMVANMVTPTALVTRRAAASVG